MAGDHLAYDHVNGRLASLWWLLGGSWHQAAKELSFLGLETWLTPKFTNSSPLDQASIQQSNNRSHTDSLVKASLLTH